MPEPDFVAGWKTVNIDFDAIRKQQNEIFLHVGKYTAAAASLDQKLSLFFAALVNPDQNIRVARAVGPEQVSVKIRLIERLLPSNAEWPDRKALIRALEKTIGYRNRLAHSLPESLIAVSTGNVQWGTRREQKELVFEVLDLESLGSAELDIEIINIALDRLILVDLSAMTVERLRELSIRDEILLEFVDAGAPSAAQREALDRMFPWGTGEFENLPYDELPGD